MNTPKTQKVVKPRKIVQITFPPSGRLYALCDDGTVWVKETVRVKESGNGVAV